MAAKDETNNLFRILLATDNHLGVWEKDQVRREDSFNSFEEILKLAQELTVDFVLLGGDLFHENKPSRASLVKGVNLFAKYCLGNRPVQFRVLSDPKINFEKSGANYENPNLNIGLPVFTIHGNHDDPSGEGNLSAVDILSSCGLVNYFGKSLLDGAGQGKVRLNPVLLKKGDTKIALYGLGHIRDERLGRLFQTPGCVEWVRPKEEPGYPTEDWFNIFVLHQNRVQHGAHAKNCIQEKYLPKFLDFVLWGHEHECLPDPQESAVGKFTVLQPGSSVATALSEGESKNKHAVLLEVMGDKWRTIKYPLQRVRPFKYEQILLAEQMSLDPDDPESITPFLENRVEALVEQAKREKAPVPGQKPLLPIVRLRVDYTGFSTINTQRFGQKFVNKVANPHDIIMWSKAPKRREVVSTATSGALELQPDQLDQATIDDLISVNLKQSLEILAKEDLTVAVHQFVDKDEKNALSLCYTSTLTETQKSALNSEDASGGGGTNLIETAAEQKQKERDGKEQSSFVHFPESMGIGTTSTARLNSGNQKTEEIDLLGGNSPNPKPAQGGPKAGLPGRKGKKAKPGASTQPLTLDSFLVSTKGTTQDTSGTQRTAVHNAVDVDETDNPPSASRRRGHRVNQESRKRGIHRTYLDSDDEDEELRKKKPTSRRRRGVL